jgi:hypothetical protein
MRRPVLYVLFACAVATGLAGVALAEAPDCASAATLSTEAVAIEVVTPAVFGGRESTGDFCDSTADHGSSSSCEEEAVATNLFACPAGQRATSKNCSLTGNSCNSGNGSWCKCSYACTKITAVPDEPVEGEPQPIDP